ncbi:MAG: Cys-tRNA(Pro) deacylase [Actinomycetia bacterium]|nr:Cys-tRNA(Pro) deacylase [Actinomycetes bacterium]
MCGNTPTTSTTATPGPPTSTPSWINWSTGTTSPPRWADPTLVTPAVDQLVVLGVAHRVLDYEHDPAASSFGDEAAAVLGLDPDQVFKTLLADVTGIGLVVGVVPVSTRLDLKGLARAAGGKKAVMADPAAAERSTGYVVGGISPFGQKRPLATFVDETAQVFDEVMVSAGRRGLEVAVAPGAFTQVLGAEFAEVAQWH